MSTAPPYQPSRREILRSALSASVLPIFAACQTDPDAHAGDAATLADTPDGGTGDGAVDDAPSSSRPRVAIVGGGAAGVFTAWLLDEFADVTILEANDRIGGNVETIQVETGGRTVAIDMGAQYFHPGPYPTYLRLLESLGIVRADGGEPADPSRAAYLSPSTISVTALGETDPRFVSPLPPSRSWPLSAAWNTAGVAAFAVLAIEAPLLRSGNVPFSLTMEDWLDTIGLSEAQREQIVLPWIASLFSGDIEQARSYSARAAMTFLADAVGDGGLSTVSYYTLPRGMGDVLDLLLAQCSHVAVRTGKRVAALAQQGGRWQVTAAAGEPAEFDMVVVATPPWSARALLPASEAYDAHRAAIDGFEFHPALLKLHRDPAYAADDPTNWSFVNCRVDGAHCEASMWLNPVVAPGADGERVDLWKSWCTHRAEQPADVLHVAHYEHMVPSVATIAAQEDLRRLQGAGGLHFAAGVLYPYDSQETALLAALATADAIAGEVSRAVGLRAAT